MVNHMTLPSTMVRLEILGGAMLTRADREPWRLERKTAGALAYLALEGATPRSVLAGLLWPESPESTARSNLRQMLRRLRDNAGAELIAGDDPLALAPDVNVDAARLELESFAGNDAAVVALEGELLGDYDFEDCEEFTDWLLVQRERIAGLRREARSRLIDASETAGDYRAALSHAERLLEGDPISEFVHRRVMRLHYLLGDRGAALNAFERCGAVLNRELGVTPMPETLALAAQIEAGARVTETSTPARRKIPLSVQRPPVLVGRDAAWTQLEAAWDAGLAVSVSGEPGVGKTRLALEFAASKGAFELIEGRPGDESLPYSTFARSLRNTLSRHPDLVLEPWVRRELSRLVPSLQADAPPPITSDAERLRFFEAMASVIETLREQGLRAIVIDDLQYMDAASLEAAQYLASRFSGSEGSRVGGISIYRSGELRPEFEALLSQSIDAGMTVSIEVHRLEPEALSDLLTSLELPAIPELAASLGRHTGGNPLFVLETLRSLIESGDLERGLPDRLPLPGRLGPLVARRLERLSQGAQRLARTAAVAGADFDLELAASVLEVHVLDLAAPWAELEIAQVVRGLSFAHDLLSEAALSGVPAPIRMLLHHRIAQHLETNHGDPARAAHHWLEAGEDSKAVPHLLQAANAARDRFRLEDAARFQERAADILERHDRRDEEFATLLQLCENLMQFDFSPRHERVTERLFQLAVTPLERAEALHAKAEMLNMLGRADEALSVSRDGQVEAEISANERLLAQLYGDSGVALWTLERLEEAHADLLRALEFTERGSDATETAVAASNLAVILDHLDRHREAIELHQRAITLLGQNGNRMLMPNALSNLAISMADLGMIRASLPTLYQALALYQDFQGADIHRFATLISIACAQRDANEYAAAMEYFRQASELAERTGDPRGVYLHAHLARTARELGALERSLEHARIASDNPTARAQHRGIGLLEHARCLEALGQPFDAILTEGERLIQESGRYLLHHIAVLEHARHAPPEIGLGTTLEVLEGALERELFGLVINALTRAAQHQLALERFPQALEMSSRANTLLETYDPDHLYRAEVFLTHHRALEANRHPEAAAQLERTLNWVLEIADHQVPTEYRESFLTRNPVNHQILEAARQAGLEVG